MTYKETLYPMPNDPANKANQEPVKPKSKYWSGKTAGIGTSASPLYNWYHKNKDLKLENRLNGIDLAEIKIALQGTLNGWSKAIKRDKQPFLDLIVCIDSKNRDLQKANLLFDEILKWKDQK